MEMLRRSREQVLLLVLSLIGAAIAVYLTTVHYEHVPLICSTSGFVDCARVTSSAYSVVPGTNIPITIPGLGWCLVSAGLAIAGLYLLPRHYWLRIVQFAWAFAGLLSALYLVYAEIVQLHSICSWCTALHAIILVMFLITLVRLQRPASAEDEFEIEEAEGARPTKSSIS